MPKIEILGDTDDWGEGENSNLQPKRSYKSGKMIYIQRNLPPIGHPTQKEYKPKRKLALVPPRRVRPESKPEPRKRTRTITQTKPSQLPEINKRNIVSIVKNAIMKPFF